MTSNNENKAMTTEAAQMMLEAMRALKEKSMTPQEATSMAVLGKTVIDAANAEIQFIRTVKAMPNNGGMFGKNVVYLEPEADKEALKEQDKRLAHEKDSKWKHTDEFV